VIDSHAHVDVPVFDADRAEVLARAVAAGVRGILVPAIRPSTWSATGAIESSLVAVALGIHPQVVPSLDAGERALSHGLTEAIAAARTPRTVAIGECGLDGGTGDRDEQERIFRAHIRAARALHLPLVVHVLRAHDRAPQLLREERAGDVGGVLHSYSGSPDLVPVYRALGFTFSFAGAVTWPNARRPIAAARAVPDELLLAETDCPDQAPSPHRGARSEPARVADVIAGLARARDADPAAVAALTAANARRVFAAAAW
jgi:TatD DNase family protein